jgi:hypothetical protein
MLPRVEVGQHAQMQGTTAAGRRIRGSNGDEKIACGADGVSTSTSGRKTMLRTTSQWRSSSAMTQCLEAAYKFGKRAVTRSDDE